MDTFILRQIEKNDHSSSNMIIGERYSVVRKHENLKPDAPEHLRSEQGEFSRALKASGVEQMGGKHVENCWGIIIYSGGDMYPLYNGFHYYIMTSNGGTFESLNSH